MQLGKSMTPVVGLLTFQSVENVSGQKPACMMRSTMSHRRWPFCPLPTSNQTPAGGKHGKDFASVVDDTVGRRREHMRDDIAALEQSDKLGQRRDRLAHVNHHRQAEARGHFLRAIQHLEIVLAGDISRQPRLDADDEVAVLRNRVLRRADVGPRNVHRVAFGQDAGATDVDQHAAPLRRRLRDGNRVADVIGPLRSRVDPPGHAIRKAQPRTLCGSSGVRVDVDQPGTTSLPLASMVSAAAVVMLASTRAMRVPAIATSRIA